MSPRKRRPKPLPAPSPDDLEAERELVLTVVFPYYGRVSHGEQLEEAVRREMRLQFGKNVAVARFGGSPKPVKKSATKAKAAPKKAVAKKAAPKKKGKK